MELSHLNAKKKLNYKKCVIKLVTYENVNDYIWIFHTYRFDLFISQIARVGFDCFYNVLICKSLWIKASAK